MQKQPFLSDLYRPFILVLLGGCLYLSYLVLKPFIHTIIISFLIGSIALPFNDKMLKITKGRKNLSAAVVVTILTCLILLPAIMFLSILVSQAFTTVNQINDWIQSAKLQEFIRHSSLQNLVAAINGYIVKLGLSPIDIKDFDIGSPFFTATKYIGQFIVSHGRSILSNVVQIFLHCLVMIFLIFYVVRDHQKIIRKLKDLSPLKEEQEDKILNLVRAVAKSAILGNFATALAQGLAGAVGLAVVGVPALLWGSVMAVSSLIPVIGTAVVWIPTVIYLIIIGKIKQAIFFTLWSTLVVGSIDNLLRPVFMKGVGEMSPFFLFLSIMGGVQYFGLLGVIYGPIILGCAIVLIYIYEMEYMENVRSSHRIPGGQCTNG